MTKEEVLKELESYADLKTKNMFMKHGAKEPIWGVKVGDMKKIQKKIKKNYLLAKELFAGLIADEAQMTKKDLNDWVEKANWHMVSEYTVAWIAAESNYGWELARKWIQSKVDKIASSGWATLSSLVSIKADEDLDVETITELLDQVGDSIHEATNRTRYTMNGFVIAVGTYVSALTGKAQKVAQKIGKVNVEMGGTACKVPLAEQYIQKVVDKGRVGKKRKMARC